MFRLMAMTFFGALPRARRGRRRGHGGACARRRGARRAASRRSARARPGAPSRTTRSRTVRPSRTTAHGARTISDDGHGGHGHGPWHGPHESPTPMTFPLMALAVGAIVAGFVGIPAALGGSNAIEHFLEPSFTASSPRSEPAAARRHAAEPAAGRAAEHEAAPHASRGVELGLMGFSVLIALIGIGLALEVLRHQPGDLRAAGRAVRRRAPRCCRTSTTSTSCTTRRSSPARWRAAAGCGPSIASVVDGAVNGTGWLTVISSWFSGLTDRDDRRRRGEPGRLDRRRSRATGSGGSRPASCRTTRC